MTNTNTEAPQQTQQQHDEVNQQQMSVQTWPPVLKLEAARRQRQAVAKHWTQVSHHRAQEAKFKAEEKTQVQDSLDLYAKAGVCWTQVTALGTQLENVAKSNGGSGNDPAKREQLQNLRRCAESQMATAKLLESAGESKQQAASLSANAALHCAQVAELHQWLAEKRAHSESLWRRAAADMEEGLLFKQLAAEKASKRDPTIGQGLDLQTYPELLESAQQCAAAALKGEAEAKAFAAQRGQELGLIGTTNNVSNNASADPLAQAAQANNSAAAAAAAAVCDGPQRKQLTTVVECESVVSSLAVSDRDLASQPLARVSRKHSNMRLSSRFSARGVSCKASLRSAALAGLASQEEERVSHRVYLQERSNRLGLRHSIKVASDYAAQQNPLSVVEVAEVQASMSHGRAPFTKRELVEGTRRTVVDNVAHFSPDCDGEEASSDDVVPISLRASQPGFHGCRDSYVAPIVSKAGAKSFSQSSTTASGSSIDTTPRTTARESCLSELSELSELSDLSDFDGQRDSLLSDNELQSGESCAPSSMYVQKDEARVSCAVQLLRELATGAAGAPLSVRVQDLSGQGGEGVDGSSPAVVDQMLLAGA